MGTRSVTRTVHRWFHFARYILNEEQGPWLTRGLISQDPETIMSTQNIAVHLPDGSIREVPAGTTPLDIANEISPRLAAASVVARLSPVTTETKVTATAGGESEAAMYAAEDASATRLVDLSTPLNADTN